MRYDAINSELFIRNRKKYVSLLTSNAIAAFNSNDIFNTSADSTLPFVQHRDIFYLSGIDQEESILVLYPQCKNVEHREILFVKETSDLIAVWEGEKYTKKQATDISGIKTVYWLSQFEKVWNDLVSQADAIYLNTNEHLRANTQAETREDRFVKWCQQKYPAHRYRRSAPIMQAIRSIKHPIEIELMQKAAQITEKAFRRVLGFVKPNVMEFEIEAEITHEFINNKSGGHAYTPIIASGESACILHYIKNHKKCKKGDVLLLDFGAQYANYASDMSRSIPVSGRFSDIQKKVYQSVLHVKNEATKMLKPGIILAQYQKEVGKVVEKELLKLKLLDKADIQNQTPEMPAYKKYFMHGTSHFLGLDTHDVGLWHEPIQENMVFTVEPGIYIRELGLGIRLEDNVVVQKRSEPINLMKNIPIEIEEIEDLMNTKRP